MKDKPIWQTVEDKFQCDHELQQLRKRPCSNGTMQYVMQCDTCGRQGPALKQAKLNRDAMEKARRVDHSIGKRWREGKDDYAQSLRFMRSNEKRQKWFADYSQYLQSPEWKLKRDAVFRRDGYMCQACLSAPAQQAHHLTYDHYGDEPLFDLVAVCIPCHEKITKMDRERRKNGNTIKV